MIDFSSFFPKQDYPFAAYAKDREPYAYIELIKSWAEKAIRLTITGTDINKLVTMQSFTYGEPDGTGDIGYTLSLREYRPPTYTKPEPVVAPAEQIGTSIPQKLSKPTRPHKETQKTYTVKQGDNLWNLAKKFYGSGSKMSKLYNANKSVIEKAAKKHGYASSSNKGVAGWWIFPGTKLVIPK